MRRPAFFLRFVLTAAVLAWLLGKLDAPRILEAVWRARPFFLAAACLAYAVKIAVSAFVSQRVLGGVCLSFSVRDVLRINFISYFFSFLGELPGGLTRLAGFSAPSKRVRESAHAILIERMLYVCLWTAFFAVGLVLRRGEGLPAGRAGEALSPMCLMLLAALAGVFIFLSSEKGPALLRSAEITAFAGSFRRGRRAFGAAFLVLVGYGALSLVFFALVLASLNVFIPAGALLWICGLAALGQTVPITLFGLGVREGLLVFSLSGHGVSPEDAVAAGLLIFAVTLVSGLTGGAVWLLTEKKCAA